MEVNDDTMDLNIRPCENPVCRTLVGGEDSFCSEHCHDVKFDIRPERPPCHCGHECCGGDRPAPFGCVNLDETNASASGMAIVSR
jgi:hypothetical protein